MAALPALEPISETATALPADAEEGVEQAKHNEPEIQPMSWVRPPEAMPGAAGGAGSMPVTGRRHMKSSSEQQQHPKGWMI